MNEWVFGGETVRTRVYTMVPPDVRQIRVNLVQIDGTTEEGDGAYDVAVLMGE